jgi:hypothetical protein
MAFAILLLAFLFFLGVALIIKFCFEYVRTYARQRCMNSAMRLQLTFTFHCLFCNHSKYESNSESEAAPAARTDNVANRGAAAQTQADLVRSMSPTERREYVSNFLKTEVRELTLIPLR